MLNIQTKDLMNSIPDKIKTGEVAAPVHANAGDAQQKISKISLAVGVESQTIRPSETVAKKVPQFGFAKGMIEMSDDFDEPLDAFRDYHE